MPFYEYHCANCGHHHEELQKITDKPLRKCPACGRNKLSRLVSAPVFRLKGGGWYETDFKSDKEAKRNLAGEKEAAAAEKEKDAKPAEAADRAAAKPEAAAKAEPAAKPSREPKPAAANSSRSKPSKPAPAGKRARGRRSK